MTQPLIVIAVNWINWFLLELYSENETFSCELHAFRQ